MKEFKKIPIEGLDHLEINEDGYLLEPKTGKLEYIEVTDFLSPDDNDDNNLSRDFIIDITFKKV